jgi:hypothetical protein
MRIIAGNAGYPPFARALERFPRAGALNAWLPGQKRYYRRLVAEASMETLYSITFLAWAVCALHALEHCDLIIDIAMSDRPGYGADIAKAVRRHTGMRVSFDDMHAPTQPSPLRLAHQSAIEDEVLTWIAESPVDGLFDAPAIRARLDELSPRRAELLARLV